MACATAFYAIITHKTRTEGYVLVTLIKEIRLLLEYSKLRGRNLSVLSYKTFMINATKHKFFPLINVNIYKQDTHIQEKSLFLSTF